MKKGSSTPPVDINEVDLIGTYVPRQCGIATFTKDLRDSLAKIVGDDQVGVMAIDDDPSPFKYPEDVSFQVRQHEQGDYRTAAELMNINQADAAIVQHEFGIYGGADGRLLLHSLRPMRMPSILTLHTVLNDPSESQATVMDELKELGDRLVVMTQKGREFLREIYEIPEEKIRVIPHGIPDVPFVDSSFHKDQFGFEGRTVILTFGLLSPGKGIEVVIEALPEIVKENPDVIYVVLGATHPNVLKTQGDAYRESLMQRVQALGLQDHVVFRNRFVSKEELLGYIGSCDVYVTPYHNEAQITSGTLAYAMGAGKATVSTPYWHAQEMLADGRGVFFPFGEHEALAGEVNKLLANPVETNAMRKRAYMHCRSMTWEEVGRKYLDLTQEVVQERRRQPRPVLKKASEVVASDTLPQIDLSHLRTLTDDTGIYQHAVYTIPDRYHGYCTDDNARALLVALRYHDLRQDDSVLPLVTRYLAFLHHAYNRKNGRFRNFMAFDRRWLEIEGSDDSHARAIWAIGECVARAPDDGILGYATRIFNEALEAVDQFEYARSIAFSLIGIHGYLKRFGGDSNVRRVREELAKRLKKRFQDHMHEGWPWCEDVVTYDNGRLSHALLLSGQWLPDGEMVDLGIQSLEWLLDIQTTQEGHISLIGCDGWFQRGKEKARFDQQPLEISSLVDACAEAFRATQDRKWGHHITQLVHWFLGRNDLSASLYDFRTGGSRDGLTSTGVNQNEGAESTLSWLLSIISAYELSGITSPEGANAERT